MNVDAAAVVHDGAHQAALGADQRVVQPGGNGDVRLFDVGLRGAEEGLSGRALPPLPRWARGPSRAHQLPLDAQDPIPGGLTVDLLARDDDHLRVAVLRRQVDLGVGLLADLPTSGGLQTRRRRGRRETESGAYLFDVGASFADDVFVELLEDGNGQGEAVLDLGKRREA